MAEEPIDDDEPLPGETIADNIADPVEIPPDEDLIAQFKHEDLIKRYQEILAEAKKWGIDDLDVILDGGQGLTEIEIEEQVRYLTFAVRLMKKNKQRIIEKCNVGTPKVSSPPVGQGDGLAADNANRAAFAAGQFPLTRRFQEVGHMETGFGDLR